MRWFAPRAVAATFILLASVACDKDEKAKELAHSVAGDASTIDVYIPPTDAAAYDAGPFTMPERPIPKDQTMVSQGAPQDVQMKAITYMASMRSPRPNDPAADPSYAADLATKLKPIALSLDKGGDKAKWNRVEVEGNGRQINLLMETGCDAQTPKTAVVNRAGVQFTTLLQHGVLVIRCNDTKIQCLQSVRDPDDVLCTTGIRHK
jgi:hypothetical protein